MCSPFVGPGSPGPALSELGGLAPEARQGVIGRRESVGWRSDSRDRASDIVRRAYRDILGREPDPSGMSEYRRRVLRDNWSENDVRRALRDSDEYRRR